MSAEVVENTLAGDLAVKQKEPECLVNHTGPLGTVPGTHISFHFDIFLKAEEKILQ